jgi:large subunit ribosomal protein L35
MPKIKTNRGAAKRFSFTKTGKVKFKHNNLRHKLTHKSRSHKRRLRKVGILNRSDSNVAHALVPYK